MRNTAAHSVRGHVLIFSLSFVLAGVGVSFGGTNTNLHTIRVSWQALTTPVFSIKPAANGLAHLSSTAQSSHPRMKLKQAHHLGGIGEVSGNQASLNLLLDQQR